MSQFGTGDNRIGVSFSDLLGGVFGRLNPSPPNLVCGNVPEQAPKAPRQRRPDGRIGNNL
jgi:hypothetical protein